MSVMFMMSCYEAEELDFNPVEEGAIKFNFSRSEAYEINLSYHNYFVWFDLDESNMTEEMYRNINAVHLHTSFDDFYYDVESKDQEYKVRKLRAEKGKQLCIDFSFVDRNDQLTEVVYDTCVVMTW